MNLFNQLKEARKAAHLTQQQMADAVDMERETYTRIERGKQGTTVATLEALGDVVGLRLVFERKKIRKRTKNVTSPQNEVVKVCP